MLRAGLLNADSLAIAPRPAEEEVVVKRRRSKHWEPEINSLSEHPQMKHRALQIGVPLMLITNFICFLVANCHYGASVHVSITLANEKVTWL